MPSLVKAKHDQTVNFFSRYNSYAWSIPSVRYGHGTDLYGPVRTVLPKANPSPLLHITTSSTLNNSPHIPQLISTLPLKLDHVEQVKLGRIMSSSSLKTSTGKTHWDKTLMREKE
uniref:Xle7-2EB protein n=1 Tax=Brassica juncea TaxID=3707 RepID=Q39285_BRAJU|nr:Xle7-2EB [Brassica juncea]